MKTPDPITVVVSFSGGRSSALLARMMQTSPIWETYRKVYLFANTGKEREETLAFVNACDQRWGLGVVWLEAVVNPEKGKVTTHRVVTYQTAIRNTDPIQEGHPFLETIKKYGLPTNAFPHCTREMKLRPIRSYMKSIGCPDYLTAVGIRADEPGRALPKERIIYPLVELKIDEVMVRTFWDRQPFDLDLKDYQGNCDLCFKKSLRKRLTLLREDPSIAAWWAALEGKYANHKGVVADVVFDRNGIRVPDLLTMSQDPGLEVAVDKHDARLAQPGNYDKTHHIDWDFEKPCHCNST